MELRRRLRSFLSSISLQFLLFIATSVDSNNDHVTVFNVQPEHWFSKGLQYYRVLQLDTESNSLYVGAMNHVYRLSTSNVNTTSDAASYAEAQLLPTDGPHQHKCHRSSPNAAYKCQNHVRVIFRLPDGSLYICGTNSFEPALSTLDAHSLSVKQAPTGGGLGICPFDPDDNGTAVWIERGNPDNIPSVYAGTSSDSLGSIRIIHRPPLFDKSGSIAHSFLRTVYTDPKWLKEPNFVASFEVDDFVYFFFREISVENANCGKTVFSRVARICKNDVGGKHVLEENWATFVKARLNCSISGEFPFYFDEIQAVSKVDTENGETHFYATFTTSLNGFYGSAVCLYRLRDINHVFEHGQFKEQASSSHVWLPVPSTSVPSPRPGQCYEDSKRASDSALDFARQHTLLDASVSMLPVHATQGPLFYKRDVIFTTLAVDVVAAVNGVAYSVIFAGTKDGEIYKVLQWFSPGGHVESSLLAVLKLPQTDPVRALQIVQNQYLYAAQDAVVSQLSLGQCHQYTLCTSCTTDPYCAWSSQKLACFSSDHVRGGAGWLQMTSSQCPKTAKHVSRILYPGDAAYLECPHAAGAEVYWLLNNATLDVRASGARVLQTVDAGLVIVNASKFDHSGTFDCMSQKQLLISYQILIDEVNCQKPHSAQAYQAVYKEWCREFQEYKHVMTRYRQQLEDNAQCLTGKNQLNRLGSSSHQPTRTKTGVQYKRFR